MIGVSGTARHALSSERVLWRHQIADKSLCSVLLASGALFFSPESPF